MANFLFYKLIVLIFASVPLLLGLYGLFVNQNASKLVALSLLLIGVSFLVYGWNHDRWNHKLMNRNRKISNWILVVAAAVYILKIILDYYA